MGTQDTTARRKADATDQKKFPLEFSENDHIVPQELGKDSVPEQAGIVSQELTGTFEIKKCIEYLIDLADGDDISARNAAGVILPQFGENLIEYIAGILHSDKKNKRLFAVQLLGKVKNEKSLKLLIDLVEVETDENIRDAAFEALGTIADKKALPTLLAQLEKTDSWRQFPIVFALMKMPDESVVPTIIKLLDNDILQALALQYLELIGDAQSISALFELLEKQTSDSDKIVNILAVLRKIDQNLTATSEYDKNRLVHEFLIEKFRTFKNTAIIKLMAESIEKQNRNTQKLFIWVFSNIAEFTFYQAVLPLLAMDELLDDISELLTNCKEDLSSLCIDWLDTGSENQQRFAVNYLAHKKDKKIRTTLCSKSSAVISSVKVQIALGLALYPDELSVDTLITMLSDSDVSVVNAAQKSLEKIQKEYVVSKLSALLPEATDYLRRNILEVICAFNAPELFKEISTYITSPSVSVRASALKALRLLGTTLTESTCKTDELFEQIKSLLNDKNNMVKSESFKALSSLYGNDQKTIDFFHDLLDSDNLTVQCKVSEELRKLKDTSVVPVVISRLTDAEPSQSLIYYCELLENISQGDGGEQLLALIDYPDPDVRGYILSALGKLHYTPAIPVIIKKCESNNYFTKISAIKALGYFDCPEAAQTIISILQNSSESGNPFYYFIIKAALESFNQCNACTNFEPLIPFICDERFIVYAYNTLKHKKESLFEQVNIFLKSKHRVVRRVLAMLLGDHPQPCSLDILKQLLEDEYSSVRRVAIIALGNFVSHDAADILSELKNRDLPELDAYLTKKAIKQIATNNDK